MDLMGNGRAITAMLVANAAFIINDSLVKVVADELPLGQIIFLRGVMTALIMAVVCHFTGVFRNWRGLVHPLVLLRTFAEVGSTVLYLTALMQMPIGNITSILQALPLVVTAAAAIFLKAPVGWRRWTAILVGFCGVVLIVRPGLEGFNAWSLLALAAVMFMALRDLATRQMPATVPTFGVALATSIGVAVLGGTMSLTEGWAALNVTSLALLLGATGFVTVGYIFIILAMRSGDISVVAPFRYSSVLWALGLGYFIWREVPDLMTVAGTIIVVLTGIYTFLRERRLSRLPAKV